MKLKDFKKRYNITWVNPNLKLTEKKYELLEMPEKFSYEETEPYLKRNGLRPATLDDLCDWYDWDKEKQVVVTGSFTELEGKKFVPVLCMMHYCEPTGRGYESECMQVNRLAMLDTNIVWTEAGYLLGIREL